MISKFRWECLTTACWSVFMATMVGCGDTAKNADVETVCRGQTCSDHGMCAVVKGDPDYPYCMCDDGYVNVGGIGCAAISSPWPNACDDLDCGLNGACVLNNLGAPYCNCDPGYHAEGLSCVTGEACSLTTQEVAWLPCDAASYSDGLEVAGDHAYLFSDDGNFVIVDISDAGNPQLMSTTNLGRTSGGLALVGDYAYLSFSWPADPEGLTVWNVSDAASPAFVTTAGSGKGKINAVQGDTLYVGAGGTVLGVFDISNRAAPLSKGTLSTSCIFPGDVLFKDQYAIVACRSEGQGDYGRWVTVDLTDPENPLEVSASLRAFGYPLAIQGNYLYTGNNTSLMIFDISDVPHPRPIGSWSADYSILSLTLWGDFALVVLEGGTKIVGLDLRNRAMPKEVPSLAQETGQVARIAVIGNHAFASYRSHPDASGATSGLSSFSLSCSP